MTRLGFTGDIALSGIIGDFNDSRIRDQINLSHISADTAFIINLEAPVKNSAAPSGKTRGVRLSTTQQALISFLKINNIAATTLANNHSLDFGHNGITETIRVLDSLNIPHTGAGFLPEHLKPAYFNINGTRYALLGYVHPDTNPYLEEGLYLNIYDKQEILSLIRSVKSDVDIVILSLHWGSDYSAFPLSWQIKDAREFADYGADLIAGHHSHVIQPYEYYNGKHIFYSLGSTIFGDFYLNGRLRALPLKTKISFIPVFSDLKKPPEMFATKELQGNYLTSEKRNIESWSEVMLRRTAKMINNKCYQRVVRFRENYLDRIHDFIFGYYRSPLTDLLNPAALRSGLKILMRKQ